MPRSARFSSNTVRAVGALLPYDVLAKIADGEGLEGTGTGDYGLNADDRLRDVINDSWNEGKALWWRFQKDLRALPANDVATTLTRDKWTLPLLNLLGFDDITTNKSALNVAGTDYPISHAYHHSPFHLMGARVELDSRSSNIPGAARLSPHSLTQQFLNRSAEHLWGIVSNGRHLRLVRDSVSLTRQAYVEFDLEAMFNGEVFPDFILLYRTLHATRFQGNRPEDCLLESWIAAARDDGIAARDQLRDGVETALTTLGTGFLTHPNNTELRGHITNGELTDIDLYRYLLRLVYRLLFLFVAEDRDLLHIPNTTPETRHRYTRYYSTQRLRKLAATPTGTQHDDLWPSLTALMGILGKDQGEPALGLPALGSFLWHPTAIGPLNTAHINNSHLLEALHQLAYLNDNGNLRRIDFAALGAEELGSVYESLLELHPQTTNTTFTLTTGAGSGAHERRGSGSYYTPQALVERIVDWTLDPAISEALNTSDPEASLLALRVLDPAVGSGHFLISAAHRIGAALASFRSEELHAPNDSVEEAVRDVIASCLYGVDINPMAVELCKIALWIDSLGEGIPLNFLDHRIRTGNSLLGATPLLMRRGFPPEAFKPQSDDDPATARAWKQQNAAALAGQAPLNFETPTQIGQGELWGTLTQMPERTVAEIAEKAAAAARARNSNSTERSLADAWCASFLVAKSPGAVPIVSSVNGALSPDAGRVVEEISASYSPFHWHLEYPEVFCGEAENESTGWSGGFDVVIGNPPFLNQLEIATAPSKKLAALFKARYPGVARGYADTATVFYELSSQLAKPINGRLGLVQPDSLLSAGDAQPARQSVTTRGTLEVLWVAGEKVFNANVMTCAPVIRNNRILRPSSLIRFKGAQFESLSPLLLDPIEARSMETWASLISDGFGIPRTSLKSSQSMGEVISATADFRDQYYGLVPFTEEAEGREPDGTQWAALVTTGLIDPALLLWGKRSTKFNKAKFEAPLVDLQLLRSRSDLGVWASRRLVPKLLLATQTRVLEVVVDEAGVLLPSVPVITVTTKGISLPHAAAALMSPPATAWAASHYMGAALSSDALKLSASQVEGLPRPDRGEPWDRAAEAVIAATQASDAQQWEAALLEVGHLMCDAYEVDNSEELMIWWSARLPIWRGGTE